MLDVTIEAYRLRIGQRFAVSFQRTLRIPEDNQIYPLPPGLGAFPLYKVEDYQDRVPPLWREEGGVFIPMYQREALWLGFSAAAWKPNAVKVAIGRVNAISGEPYDGQLHADPQDYLVCPQQPWLDGINAGHGTIRQFVAMPLGRGYTIEAAVTGREEFGGLQIVVFEPKPGRFPDAPPPPAEGGPQKFAVPQPTEKEGRSMGLGAGGMMKQKIYPDQYGIEVWDQANWGSVMVHIVNSRHFRDITGLTPPPTPIDAHTYTQWGLPWFDLYDEGQGDVAPPERLTTVKTIAEHDAEFAVNTPDNQSVEVPTTHIKKLAREG
jgi:hypothetical protein